MNDAHGKGTFSLWYSGPDTIVCMTEQHHLAPLFETLSQPIAASNSFGNHNDGRTGMMAKQAKFFKESGSAASHSWGWTMDICGSGPL